MTTADTPAPADQPIDPAAVLADPGAVAALVSLATEVPRLRRAVADLRVVRYVLLVLGVVVLVGAYGVVQQHRSQTCIQRWAVKTNERSATLADTNTAREDAQTYVLRLRSNPATSPEALNRAITAAADAGDAYNASVKAHPVPPAESLDCAGFWP